MTSWAPIGNPARIFVHRPDGRVFPAATLFADAVPVVTNLRPVLAAPASAISSSSSSGPGCAAGRAASAARAGFEDEEFAERGRDIEGDIMVTLKKPCAVRLRSV